MQFTSTRSARKKARMPPQTTKNRKKDKKKCVFLQIQNIVENIRIEGIANKCLTWLLYAASAALLLSISTLLLCLSFFFISRADSIRFFFVSSNFLYFVHCLCWLDVEVFWCMRFLSLGKYKKSNNKNEDTRFGIFWWLDFCGPIREIIEEFDFLRFLKWISMARQKIYWDGKKLTPNHHQLMKVFNKV